MLPPDNVPARVAIDGALIPRLLRCVSAVAFSLAAATMKLRACAGIERVLLALHDHLYGLSGIREIMQALAVKAFAYDPRGS
ncbi:hypothetical protein [Phyllobacterium endophyticum]|uniref:hypothetical protein n=1 Tax=Phyllobacterium endophyticum TaxID=1149773 RepID=UPI003CCE7D66